MRRVVYLLLHEPLNTDIKCLEIYNKEKTTANRSKYMFNYVCLLDEILYSIFIEQVLETCKCHLKDVLPYIKIHVDMSFGRALYTLVT